MTSQVPVRQTSIGTSTPSDRGPAGLDRTVAEDWFVILPGEEGLTGAPDPMR
jgi:hypothetical protein